MLKHLQGSAFTWFHRCALLPAAEVGVTTEAELAMAIQDKERYIRLDSHIGLTGAFKSAQVWTCGAPR